MTVERDIPEQGPKHIPQPEDILPKLTVNKPDGTHKVFSGDEIEDQESAWIIATTKPTGKSLGA